MDTLSMSSPFNTYSPFGGGKWSALVLIGLTSTLVLLILKALIPSTGKGLAKRINKVRGPWNIPGLGCPQMLATHKKDVFQTLNNLCTKYKGVFRIWVFNEPTIFVASPEAVHKILVKTEQLEKSYMYGLLKFMFGTGLVTSDVATWKSDIKMVEPWIHENSNISKNYMKAINNQGSVLVNVLKEFIRENGGPRGKDNKGHDLFPFLHRTLFDVVTDVLVGKSENAQSGLVDKYVNIGKAAKDMFVTRWMNPFLRNEWIWWVHPLRRIETKLLNMITAFVQERVDYRRSLNLKKPEALIDHFMGALDRGEITEPHFRFHMNTFTVTGHNSSAAAFLNCLFLLGNNLSAQDKVYQELKKIFGNEKDRPMTEEDLGKMTYLDLCLKETLRLFPSIPMTMRKLNCDIPLDDGTVLPKDSNVALWLPGLHRNSEVFPNPGAFLPERFTPENTKKIPPGGYVPWSDGPRKCPGKHLAEKQVKSSLTKFLLNFEVTCLQTVEEIHMIPRISLDPHESIMFQIKERHS